MEYILIATLTKTKVFAQILDLSYDGFFRGVIDHDIPRASIVQRDIAFFKLGTLGSIWWS